MQQSNDALRRAYASERQARFRERQHAVAPFPFPCNPIYNDYHHHQQQPVPHHHQQPIPHHQQQPIIHQHEFSNNYIHRMNHNLYSQANIEMGQLNPHYHYTPNVSHLYNDWDNLHVDNMSRRSPILDNNFDHWQNRNLREYFPSQHTSRRLSNPDGFLSDRSLRNLHPSQQEFHGYPQVQTPHQHHQHQHSLTSQHHQHQHSSPSQHRQHQHSSSSQNHQQPVSQHREHRHSHSQPWDFLHTSSSPYFFHHENSQPRWLAHSHQNHESPHHFRSSSMEQSEHNLPLQNHTILTHNHANCTPWVSNYNLLNSQRTYSEDVQNPHPSYENSSNLPPAEIPTSWSDPPEIYLGLIPDRIDERLSQAAFGNPHGGNLNEDDDIDLNQFRQNTENFTSRNQPPERTDRPLAWVWTEPPGFRPYTMRAPQRCPMCDAILFTGETNSLCCRQGRITLQPPPPPPELLSMFKRATQDHSVQGNELIRSIRLINSNFAFTSLV
ncbi:hypothetical protein Pst134EB_030995 [Puccinia striiformis f. sp. tritici]|nr:hypothetical protein Pst134EB_030995 [Puccinia striiformis f. sp. tritici]